MDALLANTNVYTSALVVIKSIAVSVGKNGGIIGIINILILLLTPI